MEHPDPDWNFDDDHDHPKDECGVFGIFASKSVKDVAKNVVLGIHSLQHRGQESAGLAVSDGYGVRVVKGMGLVNQIFSNEDKLMHLNGNIGIGHTRYSTTGVSTVDNAQPVMVESAIGQVAVVQNGNLVHGKKLRQRVLSSGTGLFLSTDCEIITQLLCLKPPESLSPERPEWERRIQYFMTQCEGAYSLVLLTRDTIYAVRDPHGLRPLVLGQLKPSGSRLTSTPAHIVASESCAITTLGGSIVGEVLPGEVVTIDSSGVTRFQAVPPAPKLSFCIFEYIYFSRPDSFLENQQVHTVRQRLGQQLALEAPVVGADMVMPVPDSGIPAAVGYARQAGILFCEGLNKNRYIARTFIQPTKALRMEAIKLKFNPLPGNLSGKRVVMIDDSIVRGNTIIQLIKLVREGGAKEVHVRITCPPILHPCFMGIDMATYDELVAHQRSVEDIQKYIGADSLAYISYEGMHKAVSSGGACDACFTGNYPIKIDW